ncbi:MAG: acyl carrier protein [Planctomycetota bacterium]|nr:acyl carrier protein [Planctomycetota bacterium]
MGLDLLDIIFRLERKFGIKIPHGDLADLFNGRNADTATADDIAAYVLRRLLRGQEPGDTSGFDNDRACLGCGYNLRGLPGGSVCPECGRGADLPDQVWEGVCDVLIDVIGVSRQKIRPGASLRHDLGASF